ncbi:unnamed protein product [Triticum turgidum subsp. durum]|uniref:Uncharacterized protein n=1 Tax=Triticum turgidum subsp. durum TaxID=4567 RepID=A0A9R1PX78_TRITD|nr:unnamed protein product [Triticum turgidum subsp. durum]
MGRKPDPAKPHYGGGSASPKTARRAQPSPVFLGTALFVLGFVSLFTGHIVTDADWSRIRSRWRSNQVRNTEPIDIWKSRYSNLYYGCSGRSPKLRSAVPENSSTGYLLIATSGGLNQQRIGFPDNRCCCCCLDFECHTCCARVRPPLILEG